MPFPPQNNFNNVDLIIKTAVETGVDAVWPGWGHASENPRLPRGLAAQGIVFMGPPASAMDAVGDKIRANLLAQSNRVNVIPWSGSGRTIKDNVVDADTMKAATVHSVDEALASAKKIGYPIMIKASEGGGGKGIRMVNSDEECASGYSQVIAEVVGSPVFLQKLSQNSRHLEVQVLADAHGTAIHLYSRDCSVQRRHQKIIEEGPVTVAPPDVRKELEDGAVRLASAVGYCSAGTVEYLYNGEEYSFLEVNPRLQVEHPVTESITGVNIPACQLQIAMGIPLHRIGDIRAFYGFEREGDSAIDFSSCKPNPPLCHCIASRITAEDPEEGFKPSSGRITELAFRSQPNVSANFSISTTGEVHQFADSQFGHIFACGKTRDEANRLLVHTLSELTIRGEIANNVKYVAGLLERDEFINDKHDTAWLDGLIAAKHRSKSVPAQVAVVCGAIVRAATMAAAAKANAENLLARGVSPSAQELSFNEAIFELIFEDVKYRLRVTRGGAETYFVWCNGALSETHVVRLADGGFLVLADGQSYKVYENESKVGTRIIVDGAPCYFPEDVDPSCLTATSAGKLVEYLVPDGDKVAQGQAYANMEAMKMILPLVAGAAGTIRHGVAPGSAIDLGDVVAKLDLDDPSQVKRIPLYDGQFPPLMPRRSSSIIDAEGNLPAAFLAARRGLSNLMAGEDCNDDPLAKLMRLLSDPRLAVQQIDEHIGALSVGLSDEAVKELLALQRAANNTASTLAEFKYGRKRLGEDDISLIVKSFQAFLARHADAAPLAAVEALEDVLAALADGFAVYGTGVLCGVLSEYLGTESHFCGVPLPDAMLALRDAHSGDLGAAVVKGYSHMGLERKNAVVVDVLVQLSEMVHIKEVFEAIAGVAALEGSAYAEVSQVANKALLQAEGQQRSSDRKWKSLQEHFKRTLSVLKDIQSEDDDDLSPTSPSSRVASRFRSMESPDVISPGKDARRGSTSSANARRYGNVQAMSLDDSLPSNSSDDEADSKKSRFGKATRRKARRTSDSIMHAVQVSEAVREHNESLAAANSSPGDSQVLTWSSLFDESNPVKRQSTVKFWFAQYQTFDLTCTSTQSSLRIEFAEGKVVMHMVRGTEAMVDVLKTERFTRHRLLGFVVDLPGMRKMDQADLVTMFAGMLKEHTPRGWAYGVPGIAYVTVGEQGTAPTHLYFSIVPGDLDMEGNVSNNFGDGCVTVIPLESLTDIQPILAAHYEVGRLSAFEWKQVSNMAGSAGETAGSKRRMPSLMQKSVDYHIGVFLGEEQAALKSKGQRDRRVFLRAAVYNKDIFLEEKTVPSIPAASASLTRSFSAVYDKNASADPSGPRLLASKMSLTKVNVPRARHQASFSSLSSPSKATNGKDTEDPASDPDMPRTHSFNATTDAGLREGGGFKWLGLREDSILRDILDHLKLIVPVTNTAWNHVFVNMVDNRPEDITAAEHVVRIFTDEYAVDLHNQKVATIEVKCGSKRVLGTNPTGLGWVIIIESDSEKTDGDNLPPYRVLDRVQRKRMQAQKVNSTYVYDFIELFSHRARPSSIFDVPDSVLPGDDAFFSAVELVLDGPEGQLEPVVRPPGMNSVAMVAWDCKVQSDDYPDGREFVLVASDITHMSGSFSPAEDYVYKAAFDRAIARGVPVVYIAANSGARIGLDEAVKAAFRVAWLDARDPSKGFKYLYLSDGDYERLTESKRTFNAERIEEDGQVRWRLVDVYGGVGVECLQGSGMIASVTSKARAETTTLTYVTGRSVGIGAYVARLGARIIQHKDAPLILTGASALNKLLGREVYSSNDQIGGPKVMGNNGVSNVVVEDDVAGVDAILQWLSYLPERRGAPLPFRPLRDPVARPLSVVPTRAPNDPRLFLRDFFDRNSFAECLAGWGKTVVTGRARLGGTPIGAIAVETRLTEKVTPADPGFEGSQRQVEQQAGMVWFPDSAFKTAQHINDLNEEGLPLMLFANFRGFAGGLRDMFGEVLKYGSYIVDALRTFRQPVFVYVPHEGELRGGAWVVIDPTINPDMMEMYAAETCRAGVLEPEGIVNIKFRKPDLMKAMYRNDPNLEQMSKDARAKREKELLPAYRNVSVAFAAMHDTPGVMLQKGAIREVVPWKGSRAFFIRRLRTRLAQEQIKAALRAAWPAAPAEVLRTAVDRHAGALKEMTQRVQGQIDVTELVAQDVADARANHIRQCVAQLAVEDAAAVRAALEAATANGK